MAEKKTEVGSLTSAIKADVTQSVSLYFAPVRAVIKAFEQAIDHKPSSRTSGGNPPKGTRRAAY